MSCGIVEVRAERTLEKCSPFLFSVGHVLIHHASMGIYKRLRASHRMAGGWAAVIMYDIPMLRRFSLVHYQQITKKGYCFK